ncbi:MAG TPA: hypothetical protein VFL29_05470 [Candidatus Dormibacteraeota bacterium]|nr:hypothetical protein [Candidatus Dormibacteraeota bacterium]
MTDLARITPISTQSTRKKSNDRLARRVTTGAVSLAVCLAGVLTGAASGGQVAARTAIGPSTQPDDPGSTTLAKAFADYEAAVAAQHHASSPAPARLQAPAAPPRRTAAPAPVAVTGGS